MHLVFNHRKARRNSRRGAEGMGASFWLDICRMFVRGTQSSSDQHTGIQAREGWSNPALELLAEMSVEEFGKQFRGSPIRPASAPA